MYIRVLIPLALIARLVPIIKFRTALGPSYTPADLEAHTTNATFYGDDAMRHQLTPPDAMHQAQKIEAL